MNGVDIELLHSHNCTKVECQTTVLKYLDIIRYYLVHSETSKLSSHTGFFVYEENVGSHGVLNAPIECHIRPSFLVARAINF